MTGLRPGRSPHDVEEAARAAVGDTTVLESFRVDVVRGEPRVTVRFTGTDDSEARSVHERTLAAVTRVAEVPRRLLGRVVSGRTVPLG